ncbi:MAG TPA: hypothetical protein PLM53_01670 [Spirochaetota bacterium]|nr:hypothetical protein [Spirochaetota bacterium]HPC41121.1 hypothetical protein [Spirochaetota bacterium]HPL15542.1 hypothetical protein [Spirochaetota bacterium]HQF07041.1 hypothetical protein [Spirochaetota bacterium]HQH95778.1 hypothetical protein [Spirochaetota bacterium]
MCALALCSYSNIFHYMQDMFFTTGMTLGLMIDYANPYNRMAGVTINQAYVAVFDKDMDAESPEGNHFEMTDELDRVVPSDGRSCGATFPVLINGVATK